MKRINAGLAIREIAERREFNAGNLWGRWDNYPDEDGQKFVVYSYRQWIAIYDKESNSWQVNTEKYSRTTSKHQNHVKRAISLWQAVAGVVALNA